MRQQYQPNRRRTLLISLVGALLSATVCLLPARAHPLGNFTINRYARLELASDTAQIVYIVDMAEIPTHAERMAMDQDENGDLTPVEVAAYRVRMTAELLRGLTLTIDGTALVLHLVQSTLVFPPGQADLPTLRLEAVFSAPLQLATAQDLAFRDTNFPDRIGWQEAVVRADPTVQILTADAPLADQSKGLTVYPEELLNQPPQVRTVALRVAPATASSGAEAATVPAPAAVSLGLRTEDAFARLVTIPELNLWPMLLAMVAALGWGALHALSPGHGKTIVAAYLVGTRGTVRHAMFLGLTTTLTHTAGVFLLGFVALALSRFILPELLYPWLTALSGSLVVVIGLSLVRDRWRGNRHQGHHHHHTHDHGEDHAHDHPIDHEHSGHEHGDPGHAHYGQHHHHHHHGFHVPGADFAHEQPDEHLRSHLPPGADGQPVTWRGLLALGVSGGLLPCPSALVLMLAAISLDRIGFGLVLILLFSVGLAGVLTGIGIVMVHANHVFHRMPMDGRILRIVPVGSALFITAAGLMITVQALIQTGIFAG